LLPKTPKPHNYYNADHLFQEGLFHLQALHFSPDSERIVAIALA